MLKMILDRKQLLVPTRVPNSDWVGRGPARSSRPWWNKLLTTGLNGFFSDGRNLVGCIHSRRLSYSSQQAADCAPFVQAY